MLARIRTALAAGPAPAPPTPDWVAPVHPALPVEAALPEVFALNFQRIGGEFFYCETLAALVPSSAPGWPNGYPPTGIFTCGSPPCSSY